MISADAVNGLFEGVGACLLLLNIRQLHRDKEVKGFHPGPLTFFSSWGVWNCFFYPAQGLPLSFAGGAALAAVNLAYVCQIAYYLKIQPWLEVFRHTETKDGQWD